MTSRACARTTRLILIAVTLLLASSPRAGSASGDTALRAALDEAMLLYLGAPPPAGLIVSRLEQFEGWAFGLATLPPPAGQHDNPRTLRWVARAGEAGWQVGLEPTELYPLLLAAAPAQLLPATVHARMTGGQSSLGLPWAVGETWRLTGGPHGSWLEALDFAEGSGLVRAARDGVAYRPCPSLVVIYHDDGWQSNYYHMVNIGVAHAQPVARGELLGRIGMGTGCGGWASAPHVHFWTQLNGVPQAIHGQTIGGWTVYNGAWPYLGCMVRDDSWQCADSGYLYNDGTVGADSPPPLPAEPAPAPQPDPPPESDPEIGVLVADTSDPNAERGGVVEYFFPSFDSRLNYQGLATWTVSSPDLINNYMKWKPPLPSCGYWEVFAYLPLIYNGLFDTTNAVYSIRHRQSNIPAGAETLVQLNMEQLTEQLGYQQSERWVSLGTYLWSANAHELGEYVLLSDLTGEMGLRSVNFDDMRWVLRGEDQAACAA